VGTNSREAGNAACRWVPFNNLMDIIHRGGICVNSDPGVVRHPGYFMYVRDVLQAAEFRCHHRKYPGKPVLLTLFCGEGCKIKKSKNLRKSRKAPKTIVFSAFAGTPNWIRTSGLPLRSKVYPILSFIIRPCVNPRNPFCYNGLRGFMC